MATPASSTPSGRVQQQYLPGLTMPAGHHVDLTNPDDAREVEDAYIEVCLTSAGRIMQLSPHCRVCAPTSLLSWPENGTFTSLVCACEQQGAARVATVLRRQRQSGWRAGSSSTRSCL